MIIEGFRMLYLFYVVYLRGYLYIYFRSLYLERNLRIIVIFFLVMRREGGKGEFDFVCRFIYIEDLIRYVY